MGALTEDDDDIAGDPPVSDRGDLDDLTRDVGMLITLEGGEGAGKSTQVGILASRLAESGREVMTTREPGGTPRAEQIRELVLGGTIKEYGPFAEALLFSVARADHVERKIRPALDQGSWVVSDRFIDSTRAYQGAAGGVPTTVLTALERLTLDGLKPDLTLILDVPPGQGLARVRRRGADKALDRFESEEIDVHEQLRRGYLAIARAEPDRCVVIDASKPEAAVAEEIWEAVAERLRP